MTLNHLRTDRLYRFVNRILNWYERKTKRTFGYGHIGYRLYRWLFVNGR